MNLQMINLKKTKKKNSLKCLLVIRFKIQIMGVDYK